MFEISVNATAALQRLNACLPLAARQADLPPVTRLLHQGILRYLFEHGRAPDLRDCQSLIPAGQELKVNLQRLAAADLVVLDPRSGTPVGAYPLTSDSTPHTLKLRDRSINAMCALDAVSVAPMFDADVRIHSMCRQTSVPVNIHMRNRDLLDVKPDTECMIGIRWQTPTDVAAYSLCLQMVFLANREAALEWQAGDLVNVTLLSLPDAIGMGAEFFCPLVNTPL